MYKIKSLLFMLAIILASTAIGQINLSVSSPSLSTPYQVVAGTMVTIEWDAQSTAPTKFFTKASSPTVQQNIPPDASWTQHSNFTGPTSGKYYFTTQVNSDIWIWGGLSGFIGWQYSPVINIQVISSYVISASDTMICPSNGSVTLTAPTGTGYTYQWHDTSGAISGATSVTYNATNAGQYHCVVTSAGTSNITNTITLTAYEATFIGSLSNNQVTMMADQQFTSYQWYERTPSGTATAISGATNSTYTAAITSSEKLYSYVGTINGCNVSSNERSIIDTLFAVPTITLNATPNSQGYYCAGDPISITSSGNNGFHQWFKNNQPSTSSTDSINIYGSYQNGQYMVGVSPIGWPNIIVYSNTVTVTVTQLITPAVTGGNFWDYFCTGDVINMILTDEGYSYTWYLHDTINSYSASDIISVPTGVYQHTMAQTQYVTIEATFNGCTVSNTISLKNWSDKKLNISVDNYDQRYLCQDSSVVLGMNSWSISDYTNFQWYSYNNGTWTTVPNATNYELTIFTAGEYKLEANPIACPSAIVSSDPYTIYSYLDRTPSIYALDSTMCEGDTVVLRLSGGSNWNAKQWLESTIVIGQGGYDRTYTGMINNSASDTQEVYHYDSYQVSAKHYSCPNGIKVKSNIVFIKPTVNPTIVPTTTWAIEPPNVIDWDSVENIIGCINEPVRLTLDEPFDVIDWYEQMYTGDDDYALSASTLFQTGDTADQTMDAKFITAKVTRNGCTGQSTPILLDARVFQSPAIASTGNSEFCSPGDSLLFRLAFPGTWVSYQWYIDGRPITGATNDSIWAKDTGMYVLSAFPADCPTMEFSSGVGPVAKFMYAEILENDTLIYAMPELGFYTYQWYLNGDSIDGHPGRPWVIMKDSMPKGFYTVDVTNNTSCTKTSTDFWWDPGTNNVKEIVSGSVTAFPNPTTGIINLTSTTGNQIVEVSILDVNGRIIKHHNNFGINQLDISEMNPGLYFMKIDLESGDSEIVRISKH